MLFFGSQECGVGHRGGRVLSEKSLQQIQKWQEAYGIHEGMSGLLGTLGLGSFMPHCDHGPWTIGP